MTPRREFSSITKRLAWARANGRCEGIIHDPFCNNEPYDYRCNAPIDLGEFHYDHIDPAWYNSDDTDQLSNCQVLCKQCHDAKTKRDQHFIAKTKRINDKLIKARKPRGRPMPGTKRSGLRKRMDGTVEHR